jgi:hypothetical protein
MTMDRDWVAAAQRRGHAALGMGAKPAYRARRRGSPMTDERFDEAERIRENIGTYDRMLAMFKWGILACAIILLGLLIFTA